MNRTKLTAILLAAVSCAYLVLSGCAPRLIGEAKAKEAGLAFINMVFDVSETEAVVLYGEYSVDVQPQAQSAELKRDVPDMRYYTVTVMKEHTDEVLYDAQVDAISGFVYSAQRFAGTIPPLTDEQIKQAEELVKLPYGQTEVMSRLYELQLPQTIHDWMSARFEKQSKIMTVEYGKMTEGLIDENIVTMDCHVMFENGAVYVIGIILPTAQIFQIQILSQPVIKGS
ncbi:MAG TPA: hypothetical protein VN538_06925 [Clostridia bacterium]|nr:hypothetical protein [Clostridia bacterium]